MNDQAVREQLQQAYTGVLTCGAALLTVWKSGLAPDRLRQLAEFEERGLHIGMQLTIPADHWIATVILTDAAGGIVFLDAIELDSRAGSLAVN